MKDNMLLPHKWENGFASDFLDSLKYYINLVIVA